MARLPTQGGGPEGSAPLASTERLPLFAPRFLLGPPAVWASETLRFAIDAHLTERLHDRLIRSVRPSWPPGLGSTEELSLQSFHGGDGAGTRNCG